MSNTEPMRGPSVPGEEVEGPQDLVMKMNVATSEDWAQVPLPARQQLGWHERYEGGTEHPELADLVNESPENLVHSRKLHPDEGLDLTESVTYHLEATPPPAEPAGAPGSDGYNRLVRGVPPAEGFEHPADYTLEQGAGVRTFRLPENVGLSEDEQVGVDGVGPHAPAQAHLGGSEKNLSDDTRERANLSPNKLDPHRNEDGSLKDPEAVPAEVAKAGPAAAAPVNEEDAQGDGDQAPAEATADSGDSGGVPTGSAAEVLSWVGDDQEKARQAIEAEQGKEKPRAGLLRDLNEKL